MRRSILIVTCLIVSLAGCVHPRVSDDEPSFPTRNCKGSESLVVDNGTGYAVEVTASDGGPNAFPGSSEKLGTIQSGRIDTLAYVAPDKHQLSFTADRPARAAGTSLKGLRAWCIARR